MVRVTGLYRVGLAVADLHAAESFYRQRWAMDLADSDDERRFFRSKGLAHSDLVLHEDKAGGLHHVGLSVRSEAALHDILEQVKQAGAEVLMPPMPGQHADEALVAAILDLDGNRIELIVPPAEAAGSDAAGGTPARHLGHVVLWTPQIAKQEAFYALLGFQVSDRTHIGMSFLRCNATHHSIALARSGSGRTGLQHAAFDIGTINEVMREYARLRQAGEECIWGVGRHGPGNNVFAYYRDPAGNVVEFYGDMQTVDDGDIAEARFWGPEHKGDIWGVAGAPPQPFRD
jgi:catechol 2,3-dioxygenase-like lactoylglutathione lyase family enzyme